MLTRIRNASNAKHETVDIPASNMKKAIADILLEEGYIKAVSVVEDGKQGTIRITLKYEQGKVKAVGFVAAGYNSSEYWVIEGLTEGMELCLK